MGRWRVIPTDWSQDLLEPFNSLVNSASVTRPQGAGSVGFAETRFGLGQPDLGVRAKPLILLHAHALAESQKRELQR